MRRAAIDLSVGLLGARAYAPRAANWSRTSLCSGNRPVWCLLKISSPSACTSKTPPPLATSLAGTLNLFLMASARLAAWGS